MRQRFREESTEGASSQDLRDWMAPGAGLVCSLIIAMLAPRYRAWYGDALPSFSRQFFALYPLWILFCVVALATRAFAGTLDPRSEAKPRWKLVDAALGVGSMLVIAAAIIAMAIPVI